MSATAISQADKRACVIVPFVDFAVLVAMTRRAPAVRYRDLPITFSREHKFDCRVGKPGPSRLTHNQESAGSNPAPATTH